MSVKYCTSKKFVSLKKAYNYLSAYISFRIVRQNQESNTFSFPSDDVHVSKDAKDLISSLLVNDPGK